MSNIFLPGKKAGIVQHKLAVFPPVGTEMTEDAFAQLNGTKGGGKVYSLCKRDDCFSLAKDDNWRAPTFCPAHTVEVRFRILVYLFSFNTLLLMYILVLYS